MARCCLALFFLSCLFLTSSAHALPSKGFYLGPYITLSGGLLQFDWDINQRTGVEEGRPWEPALHLNFGWNILDWFAPEMQLRFFTNGNNERREYLAGAHLGTTLTWLAKPLLDFESLRILPFLRPGFIFQSASLPGDALANDARVTSVGLGGSVAGGVRFLFNEYLYFGLEVQEDFLRHAGKFQALSTGGSQRIYASGWKRQFSVMLMLGIHY